MRFLDFIKSRNARNNVAPAPQQPKPETAKEMYSRQDAEEKANRIAPTRDQAERAKQIGEEMRQATQGAQQRGSGTASAPTDSAAAAAQLDKQNQDKAQAALSPTDGAAGRTASQERPKTEEKAPRKIPTVPRRPPSWER